MLTHSSGAVTLKPSATPAQSQWLPLLHSHCPERVHSSWNLTPIVLKLVLYAKCSVSAQGCSMPSPSKQANAEVVVLPREQDGRVGSCCTPSDTACGIYFCNLERVWTPKCNPLLHAPAHTRTHAYAGSGFYIVEIDATETIKETSWLPDRIPISSAFHPLLCVTLGIVFYVRSCYFGFQEQVGRCTLSKAFRKSR